MHGIAHVGASVERDSTARTVNRIGRLAPLIPISPSHRGHRTRRKAGTGIGNQETRQEDVEPIRSRIIR